MVNMGRTNFEWSKLRYQRICLPIIVLLLVLSGTAAVRTEEQVEKPLADRHAAIETANRISGFDGLYSDEETAQKSITAISSIYKDTTTPFIHNELNNRSAWKVTYAEFAFGSKFGHYAKAASHPKRAIVWLDSLSGQLLQMDIRAVGDADSTRLFRMPAPEEAEPQVHMTWHTFIGLPDVTPKVSLLEAMKFFEDQILTSSSTVVQYLMVQKGNDSFPAWIVYSRGIDFYPPKDDSPYSKASASQGYLIVNAETGECVRRDSGPAPFFPWTQKRD